MTIEQLVQEAIEARKSAYCPYSSYQVGAAILGADGRVYRGANMENISFGLTICAERNAAGAMILGGCREVRAVAVATRDGGSPCGACRQVLAEFAPEPSLVQVACWGEDGQTSIHSLAELLPLGFTTKL